MGIYIVFNQIKILKAKLTEKRIIYKIRNLETKLEENFKIIFKLKFNYSQCEKYIINETLI